MGTSRHEKDQGGVRHTSTAATLDDVVGAIKHLTQTLENMDNQNRTRLDAIENTNHTMLKAICNFVRQDQHESTKDAMDDVAMSGTQNTCVNDQRLPCENPKKLVSTPTIKSTKNEAYSKSTRSLKNIETIFIPGDDDDEFIKPLPMGMKGSKTSYSSPRTLNLSGPNQVNTTDNSSPPEPFMSNYVTRLTAKDMPCCFKPTVDMNLTFEETQVCAYVFNPNLDPSGKEILYRVGNNLGTRQTFQSLCPNKPVDVINGSLVETLIEHYGKDWMPPFSDLKLIYIPIIQNSAHWYLMVIDMNDRNIYHLDCDLTSQTAYQRKDAIKIMANVMLSVLEIVFPTQEFVIGFDGMDCWDIIEARGIPNCGSSEKSTLWVLEWMQMEESFVSLLYGVLEEKAVKMKVAMILLLGTHNQCKGELITNAERNWHDSIHGKH
ncbi:hypothetical protein D0Y65_015496 [Glycine soja]|uniref:Ubiquitin-like protease family profile domain-containing protein n=1 Tax=Glycine soja TaxID=3848 RepID=A0A445KDB0_GLYSO|nr:hypothetical protein D0Y65_015496 [Glycine soja]